MTAYEDDLLTAARWLVAAGCSVVPIRPDGSKAPGVSWRRYQQTVAADDELVRWFGGDAYDGLAVVCGAVSGGLEMFEIEGRAVDLTGRLAGLLADNDAAELWRRLCTGYLERTPSGGMHLLYRVEGGVAGNTKLARRPADVGVDVLIETRGEGGYVIVAPSCGRTHPNGDAWSLVAGGPDTIPTITADERDLLHVCASTFDAMPVVHVEPSPRPQAGSTTGLRPGDDYNQRATWDDILPPHGWKRTRKTFAGAGAAWTRPGKDSGVSATTGTADDGVDRLYVFSTSTTFEAERPYSKFAAYAHLEHGDDLSAAASALRAAGYGDSGEQERPLTFTGAPDDVEQTSPPQSQPSTYTMTDDGNAIRLVDVHAATIRYCPQRGSWLRWAGHRWVWDDAEIVRELARSVARDLPADTKVAAAWRKRSLSNSAVTSMVRLAQTDQRVVVHLASLDAAPFELNTPGGVADLRTGELHAPDPQTMHTRSTAVAPDAALDCPMWRRFLADTFAGDPELTTYVQRLLGASLVGQVLEQILPFAYGPGANGKTTLLGVIQRVVGIGDTGYSISSPADMLLASATQHHPTDIARLAGARLVITSELEDGQRFAEARVKQLTGRDVLTGRFMRQDFFSFVPTHTLWLHANAQPSVRSGGPAFWRRIALIPFLHTVPPDKRDTTLEDRLVDEEGPAILAWCIAGARDYVAHGLAMPASVEEATRAYERDQDTIARYVDDCCVLGSPGQQGFRIRVTEVRASYERWCRVEGEKPLNPKAFTQALRTRFGVFSERDMHARWYSGLALKDDELDELRDDDERDRWWQR